MHQTKQKHTRQLSFRSLSVISRFSERPAQHSKAVAASRGPLEEVWLIAAPETELLSDALQRSDGFRRIETEDRHGSAGPAACDLGPQQPMRQLGSHQLDKLVRGFGAEPALRVPDVRLEHQLPKQPG